MYEITRLSLNYTIVIPLTNNRNRPTSSPYRQHWYRKERVTIPAVVSGCQYGANVLWFLPFQRSGCRAEFEQISQSFYSSVPVQTCHMVELVGTAGHRCSSI
jgi:hypothetical protein